MTTTAPPELEMEDPKLTTAKQAAEHLHKTTKKAQYVFCVVKDGEKKYGAYSEDVLKTKKISTDDPRIVFRVGEKAAPKKPETAKPKPAPPKALPQPVKDGLMAWVPQKHYDFAVSHGMTVIEMLSVAVNLERSLLKTRDAEAVRKSLTGLTSDPFTN